MTLSDWFDKGMTTEEYNSTLDKHKEAATHIYDEFSLPADDQFFQSLKEKQLRAVVLAEPWCGHCMLNIPILLRLAEKVNMPVSFLLRDQNLELMDQYLTNGNRTIPIFIFINEDGNEVAKWGPIAKKTREFVSKYRENLPDKEDERYDEEFEKFIQLIGDT